MLCRLLPDIYEIMSHCIVNKAKRKRRILGLETGVGEYQVGMSRMGGYTKSIRMCADSMVLPCQNVCTMGLDDSSQDICVG